MLDSTAFSINIKVQLGHDSVVAQSKLKAVDSHWTDALKAASFYGEVNSESTVVVFVTGTLGIKFEMVFQTTVESIHKDWQLAKDVILSYASNDEKGKESLVGSNYLISQK